VLFILTSKLNSIAAETTKIIFPNCTVRHYNSENQNPGLKAKISNKGDEYLISV
jgi:hypothetical protein